jgi:hypothetical protein
VQFSFCRQRFGRRRRVAEVVGLDAHAVHQRQIEAAQLALVVAAASTAGVSEAMVGPLPGS